MNAVGRRAMLGGAAAVIMAHAARGETIHGGLPWRPYAGEPPPPAGPGAWRYFTPEEGAAVEAIVDRLIPPDPDTPGGKDVGCAVFIDRQLAGPYGSAAGLYMRPPFKEGTPEQGIQAALTPAGRYRAGLAALDRHCAAAYAGKRFAALPPDTQDQVIHAMEDNSLPLQGASARGLFEQLLRDTQQGFFADPIYGGNRDMAAWRMVGYPGTRYDYRDWIDRHNERYPLPPLSISGRPAWSGQG